MLKMYLEEQNGSVTELDEVASLNAAETFIAKFDAIWQSGPFYGAAVSAKEVAILEKWEGCDIVVVDGDHRLMWVDGWEDIS